MAVALIVAAGRGERLGARRPKAFVELAGRPLISWSVHALLASPSVEEIVVALPPGVSAPAGTRGVTGGVVRSDSVRRALAAAGPAERVLICDAARPLLTPALVERVLGGLAQADGAIAATPVTDTVKRADRSLLVTQTLERSSLWAVQTPQAFRREALERALAVSDDVLAAATDDAWLVERSGGSVRLVAVTEENLKVTTAVDLKLAEMLLRARAGRPEPA